MTHSEIKRLRSLHLKKYRDQERLFVAEGDKCISELAKYFEVVVRYDLNTITLRELSQISTLQTPQGSIAVFRIPDDHILQNVGAFFNSLSSQSDQLFLALDAVQDPGNVGTIIRTADWFGINHIFCNEGTADCYNPKVVQATMGALARIKMHYFTHDAFLDFLLEAKNRGFPLYGTLLDGEDLYKSVSTVDKGRGIIVMGNEGNGLSKEVRSLLTHRFLIPSYPVNSDTSESLNVAIATAVILSEFRRVAKE